VFGEEGGEETVAQMEMSAPGFRSIRVIMPRQVFGSMADIYTTRAIPFDPRGELFQGTFIKYVLPQIAVDASYNLVNPATAREDLLAEYAWRLDQYDQMGLS
jgi:hypothetical protein